MTVAGHYLAVTSQGDAATLSVASAVRAGCSRNCFFSFSYFVNSSQRAVVTAISQTSDRNYALWNDPLNTTRQWTTVYVRVGPIYERFTINISIELMENDIGCGFFAVDDVKFYNSAEGVA